MCTGYRAWPVTCECIVPARLTIKFAGIDMALFARLTSSDDGIRNQGSELNEKSSAKYSKKNLKYAKAGQ